MAVAEALQAEGETATPILDHQPAAEHAAQVREVRHAGRGLRDAEDQLERGEPEDEDARRQRDRRETKAKPPEGGGKSAREVEVRHTCPDAPPRPPRPGHPGCD